MTEKASQPSRVGYPMTLPGSQHFQRVECIPPSNASLAQRYDDRVQHGVKDGHKRIGVNAAPRNGHRSRFRQLPPVLR